MTRFTDNLWSDLVHDHSETLVNAERPESARARFLRRPRVLAGSSLGLAGVGAALVLALGGSTAAPAFAVTRQQDGSVLVKVNVQETSAPWLQAANQRLTALGTDEQILVSYAAGPATSAGPVTCTPMSGENSPSGPAVKVLLGANGTQVIPANVTGGGGTTHLSGCEVFKTPVSGQNSGNTGGN